MRSAIAIVALNTFVAGSASTEVGYGYIQVSDVPGGARVEQYRNWVRIEGRYWGVASVARPNGTGGSTARPVFSIPTGPREGPGELIISVDKQSPALAPLMALCARQAGVAEMTFAESADDYRHTFLEIGDRPGTIPPFFEYRLKHVQFSACAVDAAAPEQAFVLKFGGIDWLNYDGRNPRIGEGTRRERPAEEIRLEPAKLIPAQFSGEVRTFVVNWLGFAHDVSSDQCPVVNKKPTPEQFELPPAADDQQAERGLTNPLEKRGPGALSVCLLPGVAPLVANAAPQTRIARGFDLDGDAGSGAPPAGVCRHKNYDSEARQPGIDNQFYTVAGCIPGLQGMKGLWQQVLNEEWRSGAVSLLIQISGIDNEQNDDNVDVALLYSEDDPAKDAAGKEILSDYTFRISDKPQFTHFFRRLRARMVDGVIETRPEKSLVLNMVKGPALKLAEARLRLQITPDGNLKGLLGGYQDWRYLANYYNSVGFEITFGFQCPAFYNALKQAADGMKNPITGECDGISTAYDIEAVPAFIPPSQRRALIASAAKPGRKER